MCFLFAVGCLKLYIQSRRAADEMQRVLAEHEERLNVMAANMTQQEAGGGGGGGAGSSARTKKDEDDLSALLG